MKEDAKTPADSSPAEEPRTTVMDLTAAESAAWYGAEKKLPERFGTIVEDAAPPADKTVSPPDDSGKPSVGEPDKGAAKTEPASETGEPPASAVEDTKPHRRGAEQRKVQLDAQIAEKLKARREADAKLQAADVELHAVEARKAAILKETAEFEASLAARKTASPASPDPAAPAVKTSADGKPVRPRDKDFKDMASYDEAMERYQDLYEVYVESRAASKLDAKLAEHAKHVIQGHGALASEIQGMAIRFHMPGGGANGVVVAGAAKVRIARFDTPGLVDLKAAKNLA